MKKNKLIVLYGRKYEPDFLVEDMKKNLSWVDDFAEIDCRERDELWIHEGDYRIMAREKAREMGADWCLWTSPDERWEKDAGKKIRPMIDNNFEDKIYEFSLKELFHPLWYRCDGVWNEKWRQRLFPLKDDQLMRYQPIQVGGVPHGNYEVIRLDVNIYHLKMIEPQNRKNRVKVFKKLDPTGIYQTQGYDYLDDERDAVLARIPEDRMYTPAYTKPYKFEVPEKYLTDEIGSNDMRLSEQGSDKGNN